MKSGNFWNKYEGAFIIGVVVAIVAAGVWVIMTGFDYVWRALP